MYYSLIIIDDELNQLRQLKNMLDWRSLGFEISGLFHNVSDAMEFLENNNVSVILSDIKMHGSNGIDLAKYCYYHYPATKIIFMSAFKDFEYAQQALKYSVFSYMLKPLTADLITSEFSKLYNVLSHSNALSKESHWNKIPEKAHQLFYDFLTQHSDVFKTAEMLKSSGININPNDCHAAIISAKIIDSSKYFSNLWYHGKERLITALARIINNETPICYCVLANFVFDKFDILVLTKPNIDMKTFKKYIYDYTEQLQDTLFDILSMSNTVNITCITENIKQIEEFSTVKSISISDETFDETLKYIHDHYNEDLSITEIATISNFNPKYFSTLFKKKTGVTFVDYLANIRIEQAKKLLTETDLKVSNISTMVGYNYNSYFSKIFKNITGLLPNEYRLKHKIN